MRGLAWLTVPLAGDGVPLVHVTATVTEAELLSEKFLFTTKLPLLSVLVIVQLAAPPFAMETVEHPELFVYPLGSVSVAVQVAPEVKPVIVKVRGAAWLTVPLAGDGTPPLVQVTATVTEAALVSEKFLLTVSVALFSVLVIVQLAVPLLAMVTPAQPVWLAV